MSGRNGNNVILYILIFLGFTYMGADLVKDAVGTWNEIVILAKPIIGTFTMLAVGVLLYRRYWHNW